MGNSLHLSSGGSSGGASSGGRSATFAVVGLWQKLTDVPFYAERSPDISKFRKIKMIAFPPFLP